MKKIMKKNIHDLMKNPNFSKVNREILNNWVISKRIIVNPSDKSISFWDDRLIPYPNIFEINELGIFLGYNTIAEANETESFADVSLTINDKYYIKQVPLLTLIKEKLSKNSEINCKEFVVNHYKLTNLDFSVTEEKVSVILEIHCPIKKEFPCIASFKGTYARITC